MGHELSDKEFAREHPTEYQDFVHWLLNNVPVTVPTEAAFRIYMKGRGDADDDAAAHDAGEDI